MGNVREGLGLEDVSDHLLMCSSQFDVFRYMREITQRFSYRYFAINSLDGEFQARLADTIIITSAPSDLIRRHDEYDFAASNPVLAHMRTTGAPFEFRFGPGSVGFGGAKDDSTHGAMLAVLHEYDIDTWFAVPVRTPGRGESLVSYLGQRSPLSFPEMAELGLISAFAYDRLSKVSAAAAAPESPLTERELECLVWTSAGKTSVEIAKILNLSEHTVNHYLNNATRKSGTVNRTQTVAYALRNGWIE